MYIGFYISSHGFGHMTRCLGIMENILNTTYYNLYIVCGKIQNDFALAVKRYNLDLQEERNDVAQGYLRTVFEGLGIILHGATMSAGQQSFTKK